MELVEKMKKLLPSLQEVEIKEKEMFLKYSNQSYKFDFSRISPTDIFHISTQQPNNPQRYSFNLRIYSFHPEGIILNRTNSTNGKEYINLYNITLNTNDEDVAQSLVKDLQKLIVNYIVKHHPSSPSLEQSCEWIEKRLSEMNVCNNNNKTNILLKPNAFSCENPKFLIPLTDIYLYNSVIKYCNHNYKQVLTLAHKDGIQGNLLLHNPQIKGINMIPKIEKAIQHIVLLSIKENPDVYLKKDEDVCLF